MQGGSSRSCPGKWEDAELWKVFVFEFHHPFQLRGPVVKVGDLQADDKLIDLQLRRSDRVWCGISRSGGSLIQRSSFGISCVPDSPGDPVQLRTPEETS